MTPPQTFDERLPTPKLDDRRFQDLVDEAKRRVQQQCPEWTDHNVSDPGVTLIETFAWMTDQLLYRLNRVPDLQYVKFLELLGVTLFPPTPAKVDLTFRLSKALTLLSNPPDSVLPIPAETQVSTPRSGSGEQITFATTRLLSIRPCSQRALASADAFGAVRGHDDTQRIVCFSHDAVPGDALLVGLNGSVPSCTVRLHLPCKPGEGGGIVPDNPPLVWDARVGDDEGTVCLWSAQTREELGRFTVHGSQALRCVAFSPDQHVLACAGDEAIWLRDVHDPGGSGHRLDGHTGPVLALSFDKDGSVLASAGDDGTVRLWHVHEPEKAGRALGGHEGAVLAVAFDPTGRWLASAGADGTVRLSAVGEGKLERLWDVNEHGDAAAPSEAGRRRVLAVAFGRDGDRQRLVAVGDDGALWLWDVEGPEQAGQTRRLDSQAPLSVAAFSPDGDKLATAGADGNARLWNVDLHEASGPRDEGESRQVVSHEKGPLYALAFSPEGKRLATVGGDWTVRLWDVQSGEQLRRPLSDRCPVRAVAFHPQGDIVATAGLDGGWAPCEVESDATRGLNEDAHVILHVPKEHRDAQIGETTAGWLRCRVRAVVEGQKPYDKSPELAGVVEAETIGGTVEALNAEIVHDEVLGVSEGVAGQRFPLERRPVVPLPGNEKHVLVVGDREREWREVTSFAGADRKKRWFVLDYVAGELVLGPAVRERSADGTETHRRYGAVPPKGAALRLKRYMTGGGRRGNVAERKLTVLRTPIANVASVENRRPASGGVDGEDIENAKLRGPITLRTASRAVTPEDYEQLAREAAPELARVECIPADQEHGGEARLLVIPNIESDDHQLRFEQLVPAVETLNRVKAYLDRRRVIGVRVLVGPPRYHGITVAARLVARTEFDVGDVKERALDALYRAFSPLSGGRDGKGWEFGRAVREGDVYAVLQSVPGVDRVDDCRLFEANPLTGQRTPLAPQNGGTNGRPQRIEVPVSPYATVFSYRHYVSVAEP